MTMTALLTFLLLLPASQAQRVGLQPEYVVGPQDKLSIVVFDEPTLTRTVTVDTDGTFDFPHIGRVKAGGLSVRAIEAELRRRLGPPNGILVNPQVSIDVETYRSQVVYVTGYVRAPQSVPLRGNMTIMDALAAAGSPTADAAQFIELYRRSDDAASTAVTPDGRPAASRGQRIWLADLRSGRAQQVTLRDGDTIHVPKAETFNVTGYVRTPGPYVLDGETTVQKAIAMAGGVTERGAINRTTITRLINEKLTKFRPKMTDLVQPGDTIDVPQRFF
jgi:polysaccharide export outer membrane protein